VGQLARRQAAVTPRTRSLHQALYGPPPRRGRLGAEDLPYKVVSGKDDRVEVEVQVSSTRLSRSRR